MTTTTTTKKPTKRDNINAILSSYDLTPEHREFLERELELLNKKNADKKPTANEGIKEAILEGLVEPMTITEMQKNIPELAELSNQRISALVRQMVTAGIIIRTEDKRKAYFSKA